jgi:hypothetical protein
VILRRTDGRSRVLKTIGIRDEYIHGAAAAAKPRNWDGKIRDRKISPARCLPA